MEFGVGFVRLSFELLYSVIADGRKNLKLEMFLSYGFYEMSYQWKETRGKA